MFLGNVWSCLKEVMTPDVFDGEYRVALLPMQENQASSRGEGEFSWFLELRWEPGVFSQVTMGMFLKHSCIRIFASS